MTPNPVSHPSDVDLRELRALCLDLADQASFLGHAICRFRGYTLSVLCHGLSPMARLELHVECDGPPPQLIEHAWGMVQPLNLRAP
jgi:hypothetical protein